MVSDLIQWTSLCHQNIRQMDFSRSLTRLGRSWFSPTIDSVWNDRRVNDSTILLTVPCLFQHLHESQDRSHRMLWSTLSYQDQNCWIRMFYSSHWACIDWRFTCANQAIWKYSYRCLSISFWIYKLKDVFEIYKLKGVWISEQYASINFEQKSATQESNKIPDQANIR